MGHPEQRKYDEIYQSHVTLLPQIKAVDTSYYTKEDITLYENEQTSPFRQKDDLVMVFHFKGIMTSHFGGISKPFNYRPQSWSFFLCAAGEYPSRPGWTMAGDPGTGN